MENIEAENSSTCTPPELRSMAQDVVHNLLPEKSREKYEKTYKLFQEWMAKMGVENVSENILLSYFEILSKDKKPSTLWTTYSKLKLCLNIFKDIDISQYLKLQALLKRKSTGYEPKKSKILELEDINEFINRADNKEYLAIKVMLVMGYNGACRRDEIYAMSVDDIHYQKNSSIHVTLPKTKNYQPRVFIINNPLWVDLIKIYSKLRPKGLPHKHFFITYRNGQCIKSRIGINTIGDVPRKIAGFLQLPNRELYTGHCFRRSSASKIANEGGDLVTIKQHGGWKSSAVAEGYIVTSTKKKENVANLLSHQVNSNEECSASQSKLIQDSTAGEPLLHSQMFNQIDKSTELNITTQTPGIRINANTVTVKVFNNCNFKHEE